MKNTYYALRHGQSLANVAGIILSHLENGKKADYTLTQKGENEVRESALRAKEGGILNKDTLIISSPFSRCKRTAEIAQEVLEIGPEIIFDDRLRERWFGDWEGTSNAHYQTVWNDDRINPNHVIARVESANDVQQRTIALLHELEETYSNRVFLLVSHGDALQIMQTGLRQQSAALHRDMPPLETAEIRRLHA